MVEFPGKLLTNGWLTLEFERFNAMASIDRVQRRFSFDWETGSNAENEVESLLTPCDLVAVSESAARAQPIIQMLIMNIRVCAFQELYRLSIVRIE